MIGYGDHDGDPSTDDAIYDMIAGASGPSPAGDSAYGGARAQIPQAFL